MSFPTPDFFLSKRKQTPECKIESLIACPGFELKKWRFERLAAHLTDWLPEFVFRPEDLPDQIVSTTALRRLMERAVKHLYDEDTHTSRGELGELILHVLCRQFFGTFPAVSKLFYKTATNDVVKGFDIAHIRVDTNDNTELWLGEAKFYQDGPDAAYEAIRSINSHLERGFLTSEKILLGGKLSKSTPGYKHVEWLFDQDTPLDEIFKTIVIPILIAYDSKSCSSYSDDESYDKNLSDEIQRLDKALSKKLQAGLKIHSLYVPMNRKSDLQASFNQKLLGYRL